MDPRLRSAAAALIVLAAATSAAAPASMSGAAPGAEDTAVPGRPVPMETDDPSAGAVLDPTLQPTRGKGRYVPADDFRAPFTVTLDGEPNLLAVTAATLLPGETLVLDVPEGATLVHSAGAVTRRGPVRFAWAAPEAPGIHALAVRLPGAEEGSFQEVRVNLLVAVPASRISGGSLNGYRIGAYRRDPLRGDPAYLPPRGFVEVRPEHHDIQVAPHFTLGEFLCKQEGNPKYLLLDGALLVKLELILEAVNHAGVTASGLTVMSGYRTPAYNRAIGNTTDYSRHLYGDAADIYVDENGDGDMDDLNGDGVRNIADARFLAQIVEGLASAGLDEYPVGGMASYRRNPAHGPFVHVDTRGTRARW